MKYILVKPENRPLETLLIEDIIAFEPYPEGCVLHMADGSSIPVENHMTTLQKKIDNADWII